jgi:hypothetical protein
MIAIRPTEQPLYTDTNASYKTNWTATIYWMLAIRPTEQPLYTDMNANHKTWCTTSVCRYKILAVTFTYWDNTMLMNAIRPNRAKQLLWTSSPDRCNLKNSSFPVLLCPPDKINFCLCDKYQDGRSFEPHVKLWEPSNAIVMFPVALSLDIKWISRPPDGPV